MLLQIDKDSSIDGSKTATAYYLLKGSGVVTSKVRVDTPSTNTEETIQSSPQDTETRKFDLLFDGNDDIMISVYNAVYLDTISLDILSPYSENSKLCVLTSTGFYKAFPIGEKTGSINIDLMEGETPNNDEYITTSGFPVINTANGYRPKFINFGSYDNPLILGIKIVGNDKTSASMVVNCITIPC